MAMCVVTDEGSAHSAIVVAFTKFDFYVYWGSQVMSFQAISGFDVQSA